MCGISCAVGVGAVEKALAGLRNLSYRGYDSNGCAAIVDGNLEVRRAVGKVDQLENLLLENPIGPSTCAIFHCRWATSGSVTEENCHPHVVGQVAVVANGVIENSTTVPDTRYIAEVIEAKMACGLSLKLAARFTADQCKGTFAFAAIAASEPGVIATESRGIALHEKNGLITSAIVEPGELHDETWTLQEIRETPEMLKRHLELRSLNAVIVGCGSSRHAALSAGCETVVVASEYEPGMENALVCVSQSGETADVIAALRRAKYHDIYTLAVCNSRDSTLANEADEFIFLDCGPERGVAATKSFVQTVRALWGWDEPVSIDLPAIEESAKAVAKQIWQEKLVILIGRGRHYALALEGALKLQELAYVPALAFVASELRHGPLALIESGAPILCLGGVQAPEAAARGARLFPSPFTGDSLQDILSEAVWLQLLAYHVATQLGRDIDQPRHIAKCISVL